MVEHLTLTMHDGVSRQFYFRDCPEDRGVIQQIFVNKDYDLSRLNRQADIAAVHRNLVETNKRPLIIDAGANIGASAVWFAAAFPGSSILAFEPDAANFDFLVRNTEGLDVRCRRQAVGSVSQRISVVDEGRGYWGLTTRPDPLGDGQMVALHEVIELECDADHVPFLVKIDIEGGEHHLFSASTGWIEMFPLLIIELHDWMTPKQGISQPFLKSISKLNRDFVHIGENVFSISNNIP